MGSRRYVFAKQQKRSPKDAEGKAQYASILEFPERAVRDAFSAAVVRAVIEHSPAAFDGEQGDARDSRPAPASDIPF